MDKITAVIVAKNHPPYLLKVIESVTELVNSVIIVDIGIEKEFVDQLANLNKVSIIKINEEIPYVELIREKIKNFARQIMYFSLIRTRWFLQS